MKIFKITTVFTKKFNPSFKQSQPLKHDLFKKTSDSLELSKGKQHG